MMEISIRKIESLLTSKIHEIEHKISIEKKCTIYKDDLPLLLSLIENEIRTSELSIEKIDEFISNNPNIIVEFGLCLLDKQSPTSLSIGIAISYSIYLIYLDEMSDAALESYIKRRRIPNPNKFLEKLKRTRAKMNSTST